MHQHVVVREGNIPIILSFPHGGYDSYEDVTVRTKGCLEHDSFTQELAELLLNNFPHDTQPHIVYGKLHRKFCDLNRPAETAFEDERMRPYHALYHGAISNFVKRVKNESERCLLLDVHGQSDMKDKILRGTSNRKTITKMLQEVGEDAITGEFGVIGHLASNGFESWPEKMEQEEHKNYNGGWTVRNYGSHNPHGIDCIQLESGLNFRKADTREKFADAIRDAVLAYYEEHIKE